MIKRKKAVAFYANHAFRAAILALVLILISGAFWLDYAASVAFFLLAIIGLGIGLVNGFARNSRTPERLVALAFGFLTLVAIMSYLVGVKTDIGFRMLGRDLRFLLFFPIYMAVKWAAPKSDFLAKGMAVGLVGGVIFGLVQLLSGTSVQGVAGTHIVFGDGLLISGFICASLFAISLRSQERLNPLFGVAAITMGILASLESGTRGAWLAIPLLLIIYLLGFSDKRAKIYFSVGSLMVIVALISLPPVYGVLVRKLHETQRSLEDYSVGSMSVNREIGCVNHKNFLKALVRYGRIVGNDEHVAIKALSGEGGANLRNCPDNFAITVTNDGASRKPVVLVLYRGRAKTSSQVLRILAQGQGFLRAGWTGLKVPIRAETLQKYQARGISSEPLSLQILVGYRHSVQFVPIQQYRGEYADALTRSSFGNRMAMWTMAWKIYTHHWIIGLGVGSFRHYSRAQIQKGTANPSLGGFEHPHNGFLNWLYGAGTLGIIVLLSIFIFPFYSVYSESTGRRPMLLLVAGASICIFTESLFVHSLWISWYVGMVATLMAVVYAQRKTDAATEGKIWCAGLAGDA